jgi:hypothetical protein
MYIHMHLCKYIYIFVCMYISGGRGPGGRASHRRVNKKDDRVCPDDIPLTSTEAAEFYQVKHMYTYIYIYIYIYILYIYIYIYIYI